MNDGIRPEHCSHVDDHIPAGTPGHFEAVVEIVEPMGGEIFLYIHTRAHALVSRIHETIARAEAGHRLRFSIDSQRAHPFDEETGGRIAAVAPTSSGIGQ